MFMLAYASRKQGGIVPQALVILSKAQPEGQQQKRVNLDKLLDTNNNQ